jgi:WD40 repeat protein
MWTVFWLSDQRTLVSGSADGLLRLWDTETGLCIRVVPAHNSTIWTIIPHPHQPLAATGSDEQNVKFWNSETWDCLRTLQGYDSSILALALSADQRGLAVGSQDQTVQLWDIQTRACTGILQGHTNCIWSADWHPYKQQLATGSHDGSFRIWDVETGECLTVEHGDFGIVHAIAWSPDSTHLAITTAKDYLLKIWNIETHEYVQTLAGHQSLLNCLTWSPDGRLIATGGYDYTIRIWEFESGNCLHTLRDHLNAVLWVAWSPDSQRFASASHDQTIRVWDAATGECLQVLQGQSWFWTVEWSADGTQLVSASQDGQIQIWDAFTGNCLRAFQGHPAWIRRVLWAKQDTVLISGAADGVVKLWDAHTGHCVATLQAARPYEELNITGAIGITDTQKKSLMALGAIVSDRLENISTATPLNLEQLPPLFATPITTRSDDAKPFLVLDDRPPIQISASEAVVKDTLPPVAEYADIYVERSPLESICYETLLQPGALVRVKAPQLMGKTSFMNRVLTQIEQVGYRVVNISFDLADKTVHFKDINKFMRWFCAIISRELGLSNQLDDYWDEVDLGAKISCTAYLEDYVLPQIQTPIVLGLDDVFSLLRSWHEKAKSRPIWRQLRLLLAHTTDVYIHLDINQSPFNVGVPIELSEFTTEQVQHFAQQCGVEQRFSSVEPLIQMVGGHPYLLEQAFTHLKVHPHTSLDQLLAIAPTEAGIYRHHLHEYWLTLQQHPELMSAFKAIAASPTPMPIEPNTTYQLQRMGLVKFVGNQVIPRCQLYQQYFAERL